MLNQTERDIVEELKGRMREVAGDRLQEVIVYGSRAWGQASPDSDLDVAVIVQGCTPELEAALHESAYQVMWDHDFSPIIASRSLMPTTSQLIGRKAFPFTGKWPRRASPCEPDPGG